MLRTERFSLGLKTGLTAWRQVSILTMQQEVSVGVIQYLSRGVGCVVSGSNFVVYSWEFSPVTEMKGDDAIISEM